VAIRRGPGITQERDGQNDQIADFFAIELLEQWLCPGGSGQVRASLADLASGSKGEEQEVPKDLTTNEAAVEVGRMLKVPAVLTVNIPHFGEEITLTATMIDRRRRQHSLAGQRFRPRPRCVSDSAAFKGQ